MPTILVSSFMAFGPSRLNSAQEAVRSLPPVIADCSIERVDVPVSYDQAVPVVLSAARRACPAAIVCVGQAAGRAEVSFERVAINVDSSKRPDGCGIVRMDVPIDPDGPAAYFTTLPISEMAMAVRAQGLPAGVSNTAGTYVCNHLMYGLLRAFDGEGEQGDEQGVACPVGFVHVPVMPEQVAEGAFDAKTPTMSRDDASRALVASIEALIDSNVAGLEDRSA